MAAPALAADLPAAMPAYKAPPAVTVYNWNGFYVGANGGIGWGRKCWTFVNNVGAAPTNTDERCHDVSGGIAGGQIGVNFQSGAFLFGLEGQADWASLSGDRTSAAF